MKKVYLSFYFIFLYTSLSLAQELGELSVQKIMRDPAWIGHSPDNFYWGENSGQLFLIGTRIIILKTHFMPIILKGMR